MKLDYINWYLVELKRHLLGRVSSEQEFALCAQTKNHLESLAEEYEGQGMDADSAQHASVERFGRPETIARLYLEQILAPSKPVHWAYAVVFWILLCAMIVLGVISGLAQSTDALAALIPGVLCLTVLASLAKGRQLSSRFWGGTILLAVGIALPLAFPIALLKNDRSRNNRIVNQAALSATYERAYQQNKVVTDFEDSLIQRWDGILNDPKLQQGLAKGQSLEVPELRYSGSKGIFISANMTNGQTYHKFTENDLLFLSGTDAKIESVNFRTPEVFRGPMRFESIKSHIDENKESVRMARVWRNRAVGTLSRTANMNYFEKVAWMTCPTILTILLVLWPLSWITSSMALAARRKLKLTWQLIRAA